VKGWPPILFSESFTIRAFAKINLALSVLGRRVDGYHELNTVFQTVTLHDNVTFAPRLDESINLTCDVADIPLDLNNSILQAAQLLRQKFDIMTGASIHLEKRIPTGGGLGGGSSDAAATLLGLAHLWRINLTRSELQEMGTRIGADVPFFFTGGTAFGAGIGTRITAMQDARCKHLLIVTPNAKVSTAEAYKALSAPALTKVVGDSILSSSRLDTDFSDLLYTRLKNDFEVVIFRLHPEILRARDALILSGARGALLAGSGASVFGIFDNEETQVRAANALQTETEWRVFQCTTLSRTRYLKYLGECATPLLDDLTSDEGFDIGA
jgi:4-diphosphocytidyl-2-C-methyl-D-erythritol kinase